MVVEVVIALVESTDKSGFGLCGLGTFRTNVGLTVVTVVAKSRGRMIRKAGFDLKLGLNSLSLCELLVSCGLLSLSSELKSFPSSSTPMF